MNIKQYLIFANHSFWNLDTNPTRTFLGITSLFWAVMLFWPGDTFTRLHYHYMDMMMPEVVWASLFAVHASGMLVTGLKIATHQPWTNTAFAILGVALYWSSSISMVISIYPPPAAIAGELTMALASFWVLARSNYPLIRQRATDRRGS